MAFHVDDLICLYGEFLVSVRVYSYVGKRFGIAFIRNLLGHNQDQVRLRRAIPRINALVEQDLESDGDNDVVENYWDDFGSVWTTIVDCYRNWFGG